MSIELMLNAVNLTFVTFSYQMKQVDGQIFSFFVMVVAAAEAAVGLAIILTVFKNRQTLQHRRHQLDEVLAATHDESLANSYSSVTRFFDQWPVWPPFSKSAGEPGCHRLGAASFCGWSRRCWRYRRSKPPPSNTITPGSKAARLTSALDFAVDRLTAVMLMIVTGVGLLIHIYSIGYMEHEHGYYRFFGYLNLFMFFMLVLVLAQKLPGAVRRVGRRRVVQLPADRVLFHERSLPPMPETRRSS